MTLDVVFATCRRAPELDPDEAALGQACSALGLRWRAVPWDAPDLDCRATRAVVLRSPWDYSRRRSEFLAWCRRAAAQSRLFNSLAVVERNTEKSYLLDLAAAGAPVVPTVAVEAGVVSDLDGLLESLGLLEAVVKPTVSAGAWRTHRVRRGDRSHEALRARRLLRVRDCLVQPFLPSVLGAGERALVFLDGALSHAIRKRSAFDPPDVPFRTLVEPQADEAEAAQRALRAWGDDDLLYARVDLVRDAEGRAVVMELELTEPRLFLGAADPRAAERLAAGIARRLT